MIEHLIASGRIVDLIVLLMAAEIVLLLAYRWRTSQGPAPLDLLSVMLAGLFLLLALRAALTGAGWTWIAGFLLAGFLAHMIDLQRRWRT
jgi:multisubunit Na+/H+ antiporter MnhB subunit